MSGSEATLALLDPIPLPNASLIINHFFSLCLTKYTPSLSRFLQHRPAVLLNSASEKLKLLPRGYPATPWLPQVTETAPMEWWLYSHLLGEEFSLSNNPSPLQLPQGLHSTAGDTWPCSLGLCSPSRDICSKLRAGTRRSLALGGRYLLCTASL